MYPTIKSAVRLSPRAFQHRQTGAGDSEKAVHLVLPPHRHCRLPGNSRHRRLGPHRHTRVLEPKLSKMTGSESCLYIILVVVVVVFLTVLVLRYVFLVFFFWLWRHGVELRAEIAETIRWNGKFRNSFCAEAVKLHGFFIQIP